MKSGEYLVAKPKARAGDVAFRAPRRVGPEFTGGMTALLYAAREGHMEAVRALVEGGADINELSGDKFSPLVMAITNGHLDMAMYMLATWRRSEAGNGFGNHRAVWRDRCAVGAACVVPAAQHRAGEGRVPGSDEGADR